MHDRTRELLTFLASDPIDALVDELRDGPRTILDLAKAIGVTKDVARNHVTRMYDLGIVDRELTGSTGGRRAAQWRLGAAKELDRFAGQAADLRQRLLERQREQPG